MNWVLKSYSIPAIFHEYQFRTETKIKSKAGKNYVYFAVWSSYLIEVHNKPLD